MAHTTSNVNVFANKVITDELVATGNGITTSFNYTALKPLVFIDAATLKYTIGGTLYTATSNSSGVFSGTHLTSGTITEAGVINPIFSTAPDNATSILLTYTAKGVLQKLLDFCCGKRREQIGAASGDGATTLFSGTLANTPIARGQCRVTFKIGTFTYQVWDNGENTWDHPKIDKVNSSFNYGTGAWTLKFNEPLDNLSSLDILWCEDIHGIEGRDWLILLEQTTKNNYGANAFPGLLLKEVVLKNSSNSYKDIVIIGFRELQHPFTNLYAINLNGYEKFPDGAIWLENGTDRAKYNANIYYTYDSTTNNWMKYPIIPLLDNTPMMMEIMSNKMRIMGYVRTQPGWYESFYLGHGKRLSSPEDYPCPICVIGTTSGNRTANDNTSSHHAIYSIDTTISSYIFAFYKGQETRYMSTDFSADAHMIPSMDYVGNEDGQLEKSTNSKYMFSPIYIDHLGEKWTLMELDGVGISYSRGYAAEDTANLEDGVYVFILNIFRPSSSILALRRT